MKAWEYLVGRDTYYIHGAGDVAPPVSTSYYSTQNRSNEISLFLMNIQSAHKDGWKRRRERKGPKKKRMTGTFSFLL